MSIGDGWGGQYTAEIQAYAWKRSSNRFAMRDKITDPLFAESTCAF